MAGIPVIPLFLVVILVIVVNVVTATVMWMPVNFVHCQFSCLISLKCSQYISKLPGQRSDLYRYIESV